MDDKGIMVTLGTERTGFGGDGTIKAKGTDVERNPYYLGKGHQADHKVDTAAPTISSVRITSRPDNGEAYDAGSGTAFAQPPRNLTVQRTAIIHSEPTVMQGWRSVQGIQQLIVVAGNYF